LPRPTWVTQPQLDKMLRAVASHKKVKASNVNFDVLRPVLFQIVINNQVRKH
jgi:hypothetical protein